MSFKAKIATTRVDSYKNGNHRFSTLKKDFLFTKNKIHLDSERIQFFMNENIFDQSKYTLVRLEKDDSAYSPDSQFQALFDNEVLVNLVTTPINNFRLKWTHKLLWINNQKDWFLKTIISVVLGALISFLLSYRIGYQNGLRDGKIATPTDSEKVIKR